MKQLTAFVLSLLMVLALAACDRGSPPDTGGEPVTPQHGGLRPGGAAGPTTPAPNSTPTGAEAPAVMTLEGDSYWVLEESEGDMRQWPPEGEDILTDLTLWADGSARIRELENGIRLVNGGDEQSMTWKQDGEKLSLYTAYSGDEPYWSGTVTKDGMALSRYGGIFHFQQATMPTEGALYSPAELQGVWLQIGSEVEGSTERSMPGWFESLVIQPDRNGDGQILRASSERIHYNESMPFGTYHDQAITVLDEPIYEGCGNDVWSVRIGEEVPKNEGGHPEAGTTEIYVTLLDQNTLLQQQYFSIDGGPAVSYQTYQRILPEVSWELEQADLEGGDFELACFTAADGTRQDVPPGISDFYLHLDVHGQQFFTVTFEDGSEYNGGGEWMFGEGGTLLLFNERKFYDWPYDKQIDSEWFAGAVRSFNGIPEVYLWLEGGIMRLDHVEGSGGENYGGDGHWDGYVDTMNDLEGRAFAAPENTLFVLYNQNYTDMTKLNSLRCYEIDDGPEAQYVLVTSVLDDNDFWLDEDGFCREDFGTVHAGESFVFKVNIPESGGYRLQIESSMGDYFFELTQSNMEMDQNWNYITT